MPFFLFVLALPLLLVLGGLLGLRRYLAGPSLRPFDGVAEVERPGAHRSEPSDGQEQVIEMAKMLATGPTFEPMKKRIERIRRTMDEVFGAAPYDAEIVPTTAGGVPADWVLHESSRPERRLLYIHGGGFVAGSPTSHRSLCAELARRTQASVLAIDYRLMPEHSRVACVEDCRAAYRWIVEHGPRDTDGPAETLWVAGDSAGGNLTLVTTAWARSSQVRTPDAALAFSPATDSTFGSPSLLANRNTDPMLGRALAFLARFRSSTLFFTWLSARRRPCNPNLSPVFGDLAGLPPVLIQASEAEVLLDDARRYAGRAQRQGSPVRLQTWPFMVHVFQGFVEHLEEADEALDEAARFLTSTA